MKLGIIGAGSMGRWFAQYAKRNDWEVTISDIDVKKAEKTASEIGVDSAETNEEAASEADVILVAVPIETTPEVIKEVSSSAREDALLADIASAKEDVAGAMEELDVKLELVSLHPLFGPGAEDIGGKIILSVPIKPGEKYKMLKGTFEESGAKIEEVEAEEHDKLMTITQSMTHFILLTYLAALKSMKNFKEAGKLQTPISTRLLDLAKAFLHTDPQLAGDLQTKNRYASIARSSVMEASRSLNVALDAENISAIEDLFEEVRELIGPSEVEDAYKRLYKDIEGGES